MKIETERTQIEIGSPRLRILRGRRTYQPSYRWVESVYVIVDGKKIYPPMRPREAKAYIKELQKGQ
jgi:hypothetical protein